MGTYFYLNLLSEGRTDLSHVTTCSVFWAYRYCIQYLLELISDKGMNVGSFRWV